MKVLMIIRKLRYSGAYKMFIWLANALASSGYDVTVCTWANNDIETLPNKNIQWIKLDLNSSHFLQILSAIRKVVKKVKADISISFLLDGNVYNTLACLNSKTKSIICERNDPFKPRYFKLKFWKPLFRFADGAVFQLPEVAKYYSNIKGPTATIPNPVLKQTPIELKPFEQRSPVISVLGRLDIFQKRHDIMIRAFAEFSRNHSDYILQFYGDGPDKQKMVDTATELGILDKVFFPGISLNPLEVMAKSKMYVLTSDFEGIPNSLIEAMSLGLPCISTDCRPGGARLLIQDNINGFIVPQGDYQKIAEKMNWLLNHPVEAEEMGETAKMIVNQFSEEKITDLWKKYLSTFVS